VERVDKDTIRTVATDGRLLIMAESKEDPTVDYPCVDLGFPVGAGSESFSAILSLDAAKEISKWKGHKYKPILQNIVIDEHSSKGSVQVSMTDGTSTTGGSYPRVEGTFPDYREVLPKFKDESVTITVNPKLLVQMLQTAIKTAGKSDNPSMDLTVGMKMEDSKWISDMGPIQGKMTGDNIEVTSLIMPISKDS